MIDGRSSTTGRVVVVVIPTHDRIHFQSAAVDLLRQE